MVHSSDDSTGDGYVSLRLGPDSKCRDHRYLEPMLPNPMDKKEDGMVVASMVEGQLAGHPGLDFVTITDRTVIFVLHAATLGILT